MEKRTAGIAYTFSAFTHILPDMGEVAAYNGVNFSVAQPPLTIGLENVSVARFSLGVFLCPCDGAPVRAGFGPVNYRVNMGSGIGSFLGRHRPNMAGAFELQEWIRPAQFLDGLSSTALLCERLRGDGSDVLWNKDRDPWLANLSAYSADAMKVAVCASPKTAAPPHISFGGWSWFIFSFDATFYNHIVCPNAPSPDCSEWGVQYGIRGGSDSGIYAARSLHNGGVNSAMADGSVHGFTDSAALPLWQALGTRAGCEAIGSDY